jgi:ribose transport system ATP-binding protein
MDKLLVMTGITKAFYGVSVLKGVDFELDYGEVHVLLGENGAGKSTLMKILCGAYTLDSGSIAIAGRQIDPSGYDPKKAEDAGVATIYQNFHLIPHLSVAENLSIGRFTRQRGFINWKAVDEHARDVLKNVDFAVDPRTKVRDLPVSQKQMLEIAVALSKNAKILIMDEPTAALSRKETERLFKTISDIKTKGMGIIYISHKLEEVKQVGDRITVLRDGRRIDTLEGRGADLNKVITLMIGKDLSRTRRQSTAAASGSAFEARGAQSKSFPLLGARGRDPWRHGPRRVGQDGAGADALRH